VRSPRRKHVWTFDAHFDWRAPWFSSCRWRVLDFFRISSRDDNLSTIKQRFGTAIGVSFATAESAWQAMLDEQSSTTLKNLISPRAWYRSPRAN
jgi:hypothetical protein